MMQCIMPFVLLAVLAADAHDRTAEVRRLVEQLDAPRLAEREAAEEGLFRLGPAIIDLLPETTPQTPPETTQRLDRVRRKLESQAAAAVLDPSTVALHAKDMPLSEVLAELEKQSGNALVDRRREFGRPAADPKLNVDFQRTPFWEALDRVLDQSGMTVSRFGDARAERPEIYLSSAEDEKRLPRVGAACYRGPFRIEAISAAARRGLTRADDRSLTVGIEAAWEPRVKVIVLRQKMSDVRAVDASGRELAAADPQAQFEALIGRLTSEVTFELPLQSPTDDSRRLASLKGKLQATIGGRTATFRFDKLLAARNVRRRVAEAAVTLEQVRKAAVDAPRENVPGMTLWEVRVRVQYDNAGDALASHRTWIFENEAYLEDLAGKRIAFQSYETLGQGRDELAVAYLFALPAAPEQYRFVYKTPGAIVTRDFDYELKDIPLP
jgi:hypothetical protein